MGLRLLPIFAAFGISQAQSDSTYLDDEAFYEEELVEQSFVKDPLESVNRVLFKVNDVFYMKIFKPVADTYEKVAPAPVEEGATNFFRNIGYPVRLTGNLLQGRVDGALVETKRFAINSTVGLAGLMDLAKDVEGLERIPAEDLGQVLGVWGVSEGPYLVLPIIGPSNLRDLAGFFGDAAVHPFREPFSLTDNWSWEWDTGLTVADIVSGGPSLIDRYEKLKGSAFDPYSSMKNGYSQYRRLSLSE